MKVRTFPWSSTRYFWISLAKLVRSLSEITNTTFNTQIWVRGQWWKGALWHAVSYSIVNCVGWYVKEVMDAFYSDEWNKRYINQNNEVANTVGISSLKTLRIAASCYAFVPWRYDMWMDILRRVGHYLLRALFLSKQGYEECIIL